MRDHVIAVDVGTGSARAGVVDRQGRLLCRREHPIEMRQIGDHIAEYDSEQIWSATCLAVREALAAADLPAERIAALAFDATCSLVLRDTEGEPLALARENGANFDTIAWLDHRASREAAEISETRHPLLAYAGEAISPEMQIPKLMWLKRNRPDLWAKSGHFFDLADFMSWRATGSTGRSLCTLTSKWNFLAHEKSGWSQDFLDGIGLGDLLARGGLPQEGEAIGQAIGSLTKKAATELGLGTHVVVAAGMVDAYAGALGVLGSIADQPDALEQRIALIGGTSSCLISFAAAPHFGKSLWGPFFDAVFPGQWLVEAGQSATGGLLNHLLRLHGEGGEPTPSRHRQVIERVQALRQTEGQDFAARLHILPDFHGNRSPFADPNLTGAITGLTLDSSFDGLCRIYWRACVAIALALRQILEAMEKSGIRPERLHLTGGHVKNPLLVELYGDVTGRELVIPDTDDAVLVGTAMNAAAAGGLYPSLAAAGVGMAAPSRSRQPDEAKHALYESDYRRFLAMQRHRAELDTL